MSAASVSATKTKRRKRVPELLPARRKGASILWWFLPVTIVGGWFYPVLGYAMMVCMIAPVAVSAARGRYWCGWFCPRGSFFDYVMRRFSRNKPAPAWMRSTPFRIGMIVFLMTVMSVQIAAVWPDPWAIGFVFIKLLAITTVVGMVLAVLYKPRTWCGFCPMGTMSSWLAAGKRPLQVEESTCKSCNLCANVCPMTLSPHKPDKSHADCIKCEQCVHTCRPKALSFQQHTSDTQDEQAAPHEEQKLAA